MELLPDWIELINLFNENNVEYAIIGAHAVSFYTTPRGTADLDLVIAYDQENAKKARAALAEFGVLLSDHEARKLGRPDSILQIGVAPFRLDLLTSIPGVPTEEIVKMRVRGKFPAVEAYVISREHLVAAKIACGRPKDLDDVARLRRGRKRT